MVDILLYTVYGLLAAALAAALWSSVRGSRRNPLPRRVAGIKVRAVAWSVAALTVLTLGLSLLTAQTTPLTVSGRSYDDALWLRLSDMMIDTSLVLMAVAAVGVAAGACGVGRRLSQRRTKH